MVTMNNKSTSAVPLKNNRMASLQWYYHRLMVMDPVEVVGRVREKLRARTEARDAGALDGARVSAEPLPAPWLPPVGSAPSMLKDQLARDAKKLLAGTWSLYGWREIQVALPPIWHKDHAGGVEVPCQERHLNHRSLPPGADARTIWEINRWAEMVRLAMHGRENGDLTAIGMAQSWLLDWVEKNPMGRGINWTSALEGGLRLMNFCWFDALVRDGADAPARKDAQIMAAQRRLVDAIIPTHTWWVKRYASFGSSANNHRLGELTGLLLAVTRWPEMECFVGSAVELWKEIAHCVMAQFGNDGGNHEQALHYHLFAFEMALHASRAMKVNDGPVMERLSLAAEFFSRMEHPGGEPWDYGDSDDAQIVPLPSHRAHAAGEWRAWLSDESSGDGVALNHWLGNAGSLRVTANHPSEAGWWFAKDAGMAVGQLDGWKVRLDASPLGFGKMAAHGHGDALHLSLWDGEQALVIDPGTGGYFGARELRAELAAWEAHNGPQPVDSFKTPRRMGAFLLTQHHARPGLVKEKAQSDAMKASLDHEGHRFTRTVRLGDGGGHSEIHVHDEEQGGGGFRVRWYFTPECYVAVKTMPMTSSMGEVGLRRGAHTWRMQVRGESLQIELKRARASRSYGRVEDCVVLEVRCTGSLETVFARADA
ncbi:heparinase II/III-like protein [Roseimicrobium gellanilyticum]|uniref:Heparinase II/III-like protein n=1 Tax=Roseimicrobium gellanilyticum TaxID=748857 RepID=A0A366H325_9BACT|nr:heparinase II/III family protein [Roseimicrobium gellanilyticum]RBP36358.1 heparinase II/III-like protein [Roseimicrobium gellanilyticum]